MREESGGGRSCFQRCQRNSGAPPLGALMRSQSLLYNAGASRMRDDPALNRPDRCYLSVTDISGASAINLSGSCGSPFTRIS